MFNAIRSVRIQRPLLFSSTLPNYPTVQPTSGSRFRQAAANHPENKEDMEQSQSQPQHPPDHEDKKGDMMSHSFGEGYSTRSNDDGFGGVYGGNQSLPGGDEDLGVTVNHPEYDKSQGSEVKEKEKARHQTHAHS